MFWFGRATTVSVTCLVVMAGTGVSAFRSPLQRGGFGVVRFTTQWLGDPGESVPGDRVDAVSILRFWA